MTVQSGGAALGLKFLDHGSESSLQAVEAAEPRAEANRVEYRRGEMTEWYVSGPLGLEQGFTLARAPEQGSAYVFEDIPPTATAPPSAHWQPVNTRGYKYLDSTLAHDGLKRARVVGGRTGTPRRTRVGVRGEGVNPPDPTIPVSLPVDITAQVIDSATGICFGQSFGAAHVRTNRANPANTMRTFRRQEDRREPGACQGIRPQRGGPSFSSECEHRSRSQSRFRQAAAGAQGGGWMQAWRALASVSGRVVSEVREHR